MSKRFRFSLENILKYQKNLEDDKVINLKNKQYQLTLEKKKLDSAKSLKERVFNDISDNEPGKLDILGKRINQAYVDQLSGHINTQVEIFKKSTESVVNARELLQEETKKKKILEKLKEKQLDKYKIKLRRKEEKDNSEIALRKSFFNKN